MAEQHSGFWDTPVSRRDLGKWAGFVAGSFVLGAGAQAAVKGEEQDLLRGPYWPLDWERVGMDADTIAWQRFPGHNELLSLSDIKYHVGVMATNKAALDEQAAAIPGARRAVAWRVDAETVEFGIVDYGVDTAQSYPDKYIVGVGVGGSDLRATQALWQPDEQRLVVPQAGVETLPPTLTYNMRDEYPGVMLV
jgi:hypothetical protein